jgi:hypothetical protein
MNVPNTHPLLSLLKADILLFLNSGFVNIVGRPLLVQGCMEDDTRKQDSRLEGAEAKI